VSSRETLGSLPPFTLFDLDELTCFWEARANRHRAETQRRGGGGVGTRLSPVTGEVLTEYACEGLDFVTRGSLIGIDSGDLNKAGKEATLTYAVNAKGAQQVAFGEFPAGGGPFLEQSLISPPGSNYPEGLTTVVSYKERGPAVEIDA
jgi:hypothetical protein